MAVVLFNDRPIEELEKPLAEPHLTNVYEVVRAQSGVVLFAEEHFERLKNSLHIANVASTLSFEKWLSNAHQILHLNSQQNINIRFDYYCYNGKVLNSLVAAIASTYPSDLQRKNGILVCLYHAERHHPNAKITDLSVRESANRLMSDTGSYEALLVNTNGEITEGSRSNFFAIINNKLITAPDHLVLQGIMRSQILKIANDCQIPTELRPIKTDEIPLLEGGFITGTSPRVLAIHRIGQVAINHQHQLVNLMFDKIEQQVAQYIARHQ